jgi:hypothetical protein
VTSQLPPDPQRVLPVPGLPGGRPISTAARCAAEDWLLEELRLHERAEPIAPGNVSMLIDVAARDLEHDNLDLVLRMLSHYMDLTAAIRVVVILETEGQAEA